MAGQTGWTLTRDQLLSHRLNAGRLDLSTQRHILSLGCAATRRGRRGGRLKPKEVSYCREIPVITGHRPASCVNKPSVYKRKQE